jgi:hypothetical protein
LVPGKLPPDASQLSAGMQRMIATFDFNFATNEPHTNDVVRFDIYFHCWHRKKDGSVVHFTGQGGELVLNAESNSVAFDGENEWFDPLFYVRHPNGNLKLRDRRSRFSCQLVAEGSGGNWYWTTTRVHHTRWAHLFNWLRRRKGVSVTEWQTDFREMVWEKRGPIRREDIREFGRWWVKDFNQQNRS